MHPTLPVKPGGASVKHLATIAVILISIGLSRSASAGHDQGNGGDIYALQFVSVAQKVTQYLLESKTPKLDLNTLRAAVATVKVETTDNELYLNGLPKDALNFPKEHRIVFNRRRWRAMDPGEKPALVLHEYLGILGIENASYSYSRSLLGSFKYDDSHIQCEIDNQRGSVSLGVDESYGGVDTILLGVNIIGLAANGWDIRSAQVPTATLSKMIRDGVVMISLTHEQGPVPQDLSADLISLQRRPGPDSFAGFLAHQAATYPITCTISNTSVNDRSRPN